jgi:RNA polymerase sigma-70 factor, ECF subfamily
MPPGLKTHGCDQRVDRDPDKRVSEFVRLTEPCHKQLYGIALSLCKDADQANDLTQETLIRAFEAFDQFRPGAPIMPWLRQILRHIFLDTFKTGRARHEISERELSSVEGSPCFEVADDRNNPLAQVERSQLSRWLQEEIAALDPAHQQVLMLCIMQDLSFEEAAESAGIPVGTISSRLARARAQLRERMTRKIAMARRHEGNCMESVFLDEKDSIARRPSGDPQRSDRSKPGVEQGVEKEYKKHHE